MHESNASENEGIVPDLEMFFTTSSVEASFVLCTMSQGFSFGAVGQVVAESQAYWAVVAKLPEAGL